MLPIIIIAAVVVPLLVLSFIAMRRSRAAGEHPVGEDEATRRRNEEEFAEAERYQVEWRKHEHDQHRDSPL